MPSIVKEIKLNKLSFVKKKGIYVDNAMKYNNATIEKEQAVQFSKIHNTSYHKHSEEDKKIRIALPASYEKLENDTLT